ncbi:chaperonin 10-like protein [Syncephalastrum racemosum]|uniref:Chaperonin 10-like protein n=1 Tax=Syncephalastrum racemosum TaxID=13706 RepID=A0A1X2H9I4_SYNRA|nr:chaperonin 10-like protein [Syncephalastrum racemosum]
MGFTRFEPPYEVPQSSTHNYGIVMQKRDPVMKSLLVPVPKYGEAQIQMKATSISRLDLEQASSSGHHVLGSEGAGIVTALGPGVHGLQIGDRVAIEPAIPCSECTSCLLGRYNLCVDLKIRGRNGCDGLLGKYVTHPAEWLHRVPDGVTFSEAALLEPLAMAMAAIERSGVGVGQSLLISGSNAVGLLVCAVAKAVGVGPIIVTDMEAGAFGRASQMGADLTYLAHGEAEDCADAMCVKAKLLEGVDAAIECSAEIATDLLMRISLLAVREGGVCCRLGCGSRVDQVIPVRILALRDITLRGVQRFPVSRIQEAFSTACSSTDSQGHEVHRVQVIHS